MFDEAAIGVDTLLTGAPLDTGTGTGGGGGCGSSAIGAGSEGWGPS